MSRQRKIWGWGWQDGTPPSSLANAMTSLRAIGLTPLHTNTPPDIAKIQQTLRLPRFQLSPELETFTTSDNLDRMRHSFGQSFRDVVRGIRGDFGNPPDFVSYPEMEEHVGLLMEFAGKNKVSLIPWGGGTSVVGGVTPPEDTWVISVDMSRMNAVLHVDKTSLLVRVQAGILGPQLNLALKAHGLTLRHFPQSWEFSSVGGWVATHAGGHYSTVETHINDFVHSLRVITPSGTITTPLVPFSGAGPSVNHMFIGSEGILGIITEVTLRVQEIIRYKASASITFPSFIPLGTNAVKCISQSRLHPTVCRLIDPLESHMMGLSPEGKATLILEFESPKVASVEHSLLAALELCKEFSGSWTEKDIKKNDEKKGENTEVWRDNFLKMPYLRDALALQGVILETFETSCTWNNFQSLHLAVNKAFGDALAVFGGKGTITCRFTHIYPDGPAPYFTMIIVGNPKKQLEEFDQVKQSVSNALLLNGGTITHHHSTGRDHQPFYVRERDPLYLNLLWSVKNTLDPHFVMNPGVLLKQPHASKL